MSRALSRGRTRFLNRVLSPAEREELGRRGLRGAAEAAFVAGRFAAKEAVAKAVGTGAGRLGWANVSVTGDPRGRPVCVLLGPAAAAAREAGVSSVLVSITHTGGTVAACAVALRDEG